MRRIERHQRRKSVTPLGNDIQCLGIGGFIGIVHLQLRTDDAGIGERQAGVKAALCGRLVQRRNLQCVVLFGDDNARVIWL
jgi:hypothetical protein